MKTKFRILAVLMFVSTQFFGQVTKTRPFKDVPYPNYTSTIEFTVLDINFDKQLVAFKHVFKLHNIYNEIGEIYKLPCNCHYKDMKDTLAGVVLGVYNLANQKYLKTFTIYQVAYDKSDCCDYRTSKQKLDSAKLFFQQNNLDITKKPKPLPFVAGQFEIDGVKFTYTNQKGDLDSMFTISKLFATKIKQKEIYRVYQEDQYYMASGGKTKYLAAYKQENKIVFLSVFDYISNMAGGANRDTYQFSPIFNLLKIK